MNSDRLRSWVRLGALAAIAWCFGTSVSYGQDEAALDTLDEARQFAANLQKVWPDDASQLYFVARALTECRLPMVLPTSDAHNDTHVKSENGPTFEHAFHRLPTPD